MFQSINRSTTAVFGNFRTVLKTRAWKDSANIRLTGEQAVASLLAYRCYQTCSMYKCWKYRHILEEREIAEIIWRFKGSARNGCDIQCDNNSSLVKYVPIILIFALKKTADVVLPGQQNVFTSSRVIWRVLVSEVLNLRVWSQTAGLTLCVLVHACSTTVLAFLCLIGTLFSSNWLINSSLYRWSWFHIPLEKKFTLHLFGRGKMWKSIEF